LAEDLTAWTGRIRSDRDTPDALRVAELAATLDDPRSYPAGSDLPTGWHWILFHTVVPTGTLTVDGHAPRGPFLPPVKLPRRMWAGGRLRLHRPLRVDEPVERKSEIASVTEKTGRNGRLVFVGVHQRLHGPGGLAIEEEQDIVYREAGAGSPPPQPVPHAAPAWTKEIRTNEALLFRYSALIFNAHRIHYDRDYATRTEGYGGLVVHGPLIATYLLELLRERSPHARLAAFGYRGVSPLFDAEPFRVCGQPSPDGRTVELWAETPQGALAMSARAEVAA
jgi:3-methylfumaryl-CoA hydratase